MNIRTVLDLDGESVVCVLRFRGGKLVWCRAGEERAMDVTRDYRLRKDWEGDAAGAEEIPEEAFEPCDVVTPRYVDYYATSAIVGETHRGPVTARTRNRIYHPLALYSREGQTYLGTTEVVIPAGATVVLQRRAWIRHRSDRFPAWEHVTDTGVRCWISARELDLPEHAGIRLARKSPEVGP